METVKLTIDGRHVEVEKGMNLVEAAAAIGVKIHTHCYMNLHGLGYGNGPGSSRI